METTINNRPVILTLFSNDEDAYLDALVEEQQSITDALSQKDDDGWIKFHIENYTSNKRISELLSKYYGRIMLLHFGGHATGSQLQFRNGVGHGEGLARQFKDISVVFLNGCATVGHVEALLENGVKAVIATQSAVNDTKSVFFAKSFYQLLGKGHTLGDAFEKAKNDLMMQYGNKSPKIRKGLKIKRESIAEFFPWGIYTSNQAIYQWRLPDKHYHSNRLVTQNYENSKVSEPNIFLLKSVYSKIKHNNPIIEQLRQIYLVKKKPKPTLMEVTEGILRSFLAPISEELRRLFTSDLLEFNYGRLSAIHLVYQRTVQLLAFILLSNLWDNKDNSTLSDEQRQLIQVFFELDEFTYLNFDFFKFIKTLIPIIENHFIEEIVQVDFSDNSPISKSVHFLKNIPSLILDASLKDDEIRKKSCQRAEVELTTFLKEFHALVKYKLLVVKNIKILQFKNNEPEYVHEVVELDNNKNHEMTDYTQKFKPHTDSEAVILFKNQANAGLNLSPFVIDENTLIGEKNSKIYFYAYAKTAKEFIFSSINDKAVRSTKQNHFNEIGKQILRAKSEILKQGTEAVFTLEHESNIEEFDF